LSPTRVASAKPYYVVIAQVTPIIESIMYIVHTLHTYVSASFPLWWPWISLSKLRSGQGPLHIVAWCLQTSYSTSNRGPTNIRTRSFVAGGAHGCKAIRGGSRIAVSWASIGGCWRCCPDLTVVVDRSRVNHTGPRHIWDKGQRIRNHWCQG